MKDYYQTLGMSTDASLEDIEKPSTEDANAGVDIGVESSSTFTDFSLGLRVRH